MDIGFDQIALQIASSTSAYLVTFSPVFLFIGGLVLAIVVISALIGTVSRNDDDDIFENRGRNDWI